MRLCSGLSKRRGLFASHLLDAVADVAQLVTEVVAARIGRVKVRLDDHGHAAAHDPLPVRALEARLHARDAPAFKWNKLSNTPWHQHAGIHERLQRRLGSSQLLTHRARARAASRRSAFPERKTHRANVNSAFKRLHGFVGDCVHGVVPATGS